MNQAFLTTFKINLLLIVIGFSPYTYADNADSTVYDLQDSLLDLHSININKYDTTEIRLLVGNEDMGGLVNHNGLGFEHLWLAEYWENTKDKQSLNSLQFICNYESVKAYSQTLDIKTGIVTTHLKADNIEYESEIFLSKSKKELLIMKVKNLHKKPLNLKLELPVNRRVFNSKEVDVYKTSQVNDRLIMAANSDTSFTQLFWASLSNKKIIPTSTNSLYDVAINSFEEVILVFSVATHWQGANFSNRALNALYGFGSYETEKKIHSLAWEKEWRKTGFITVPNTEYERLFYRSVYYTLSSAASEMFLPGEAQFASPNWGMRPYTYGAAGWSVRTLALLGHEDKAKNMAKKHFTPLALKNNARKYTTYIKNNQYEKFWEYPTIPEQDVEYYFDKGIDSLLIPNLDITSMGFGHQLSIFNDCRIRRAHQRGINAFAAAFFHQLSEYYPDDEFTLAYTYPVMKGTANFWEDLLIWNDSAKAYILPKLHSVSENITEKSILDCAIAAKWNLMMASRYAKKLNLDKEKQLRWMELSNNILIPQNDSIYLEYLNDKGNREGSGYFGIRAPVYLGYPGYELIPFLDKEKAANTLDLTWERNEQGKGMITFIASWFGSTEAHLGRGNECIRYLERNLQCVDKSQIALFEFENDKPYFQTSYAAYVQFILSMMIQSYDDTIKVFPAIPDTWGDISFYNVHVEDGISVSGKMENGKVDFISFDKEGKKILKTKQRTISIDENGDLSE